MIIDTSSTKVKKIIIHRIGNKLRDEGYIFSQSESEQTPSLENRLLQHYLAPIIRNSDEYNFYHESDLALNTVCHYSDLIFKENSLFLQHSQDIAKHLYSNSTHPNIGGGEFIVILFDDIRVNEEKMQGLGLLRIENKSDYLDVKDQNGSLNIIECIGISLDKIQKGALILSTLQKVYVIDSDLLPLNCNRLK